MYFAKEENTSLNVIIAKKIGFVNSILLIFNKNNLHFSQSDRRAGKREGLILRTPSLNAIISYKISIIL